MATATVSKKGWVVIPKALREKYNLGAGSKVHFAETGGSLLLVRVPDDPIEAAYGVLRGLGGPSLLDEVIREHRDEAEKDEW